jgi:hypothetical protein
MPRGVPNKPKTVCIKMRHRTHLDGVMVDPQDVLEVGPDVAEHLIATGYADACERSGPPDDDEPQAEDEEPAGSDLSA